MAQSGKVEEQYMSKGPSAHLSWAELACHDGTPYPPEWRDNRAVNLAACFEAVRVVVSQPITIGSAYRTPSYNRKVGGAKNSQHMEGRALDLYPPKGWTVDHLWQVVHDIATHGVADIRGIGRYPTFVHMDIRPSARIILWEGNRAWAEVPGVMVDGGTQ